MKPEDFRRRVKEIAREHVDKVAALDEWRRGLLADLALEFARSSESEAPSSPSMTVTPSEPSAPAEEEPKYPTPKKRKLVRGEIDRKLDEVMPDMAGREIDVEVVTDLLSRMHPQLEFNRSTVYGGLERQAAAKKIEIVTKGGRGEGNRTVYKVPAKEAPAEV